MKLFSRIPGWFFAGRGVVAWGTGSLSVILVASLYPQVKHVALLAFWLGALLTMLQHWYLSDRLRRAAREERELIRGLGEPMLSLQLLRNQHLNAGYLARVERSPDVDPRMAAATFDALAVAFRDEYRKDVARQAEVN